MCPDLTTLPVNILPILNQSLVHKIVIYTWPLQTKVLAKHLLSKITEREPFKFKAQTCMDNPYYKIWLPCKALSF
jgi:hypothetical protein